MPTLRRLSRCRVCGWNTNSHGGGGYWDDPARQIPAEGSFAPDGGGGLLLSDRQGQLRLRGHRRPDGRSDDADAEAVSGAVCAFMAVAAPPEAQGRHRSLMVGMAGTGERMNRNHSHGGRFGHAPYAAGRVRALLRYVTSILGAAGLG